ncbi:MAG: PAS domain S-box protein [Nitrospinota bacterium]|jgi:PAS domain S-box-containing protein|nr:PAS domain S-box protein [Nitrospinota bacterium]
MSPEKFKKKIWKHFGATLFLVLVISLVWEFGLEDAIKSSIQISSKNGMSWLDTGVHIGIILVAMLFTLPGLVGGVQETKKTVVELGKTERRYKSIVESTNDLIFQLDGNGIVVFANPAVRLLGYEDGEMVGEFIGDLLYMDSKEHALPRIMTKRVGHRATYHLPVQLRTSPNSVISTEIPAIEFAVDACGLWEESDELVQTRGVEKNFIGTLCIARPVIKPEDLLTHKETQTV